MFKVNQTVRHLSYGIGVITSIEERVFNDKAAKFYIVTIADNGAPKKCFVPFDSATQRMRAVITKKQANEVIQLMKEWKNSSIDHQTWNRRYREYMERIHTGNVSDIAEVIMSLRYLRAEKDLSFGERKLLEQAEQTLRDELGALGLALP